MSPSMKDLIVPKGRKVGGGQDAPDAQSASAPVDHSIADTHAPCEDGGAPADQSADDTHATSVNGGHRRSDTHPRPAPVDHSTSDAQTTAVGGGHSRNGNQGAPAPVDHEAADTQVNPVGGGHSTTDALGEGAPADHGTTDTQAAGVGGGHWTCDTQTARAPADAAYRDLLLATDYLSDIEGLRISTENRVRALAEGKDHATPGGDLTDTPTGRMLMAQTETLKGMEHEATLTVKKVLRQHPLAPWMKATVGIGEKQGARLLAAIGDPLVYFDQTTETMQPRTVSKLWAFCGFHVIDGKRPRHRRGVQANWSNEAKMRARLIAESCVKQMHSPYRAVYDRERAKWASRETTDLHKHNHALAVVAKEILKDLFREALRLADQSLLDTPGESVGGPAQANDDATPKVAPPAQAVPAATPIERAPAQASEPPTPTEHAPAQAIDGAPPKQAPPARANTTTTPNDLAPARA